MNIQFNIKEKPEIKHLKFYSLMSIIKISKYLKPEILSVYFINKEKLFYYSQRDIHFKKTFEKFNERSMFYKINLFNAPFIILKNERESDNLFKLPHQIIPIIILDEGIYFLIDNGFSISNNKNFRFNILLREFKTCCFNLSAYMENELMDVDCNYKCPEFEDFIFDSISKKISELVRYYKNLESNKNFLLTDSDKPYSYKTICRFV